MSAAQMLPLEAITHRIYVLREQKVLLDSRPGRALRRRDAPAQ